MEMKKALLVIDMQEFTVGENHDNIFKYPGDIVARVNKVIDENVDSVIIYISNLMRNNIWNKFAPFQCYEGTLQAELVKGLHVNSKYCFTKYKGDAFSNPKLTTFIKGNGIDLIELVGVDGGGCVSLTAISACDLGFKVVLNNNAIGTTFVRKRDKYFKRLKKLGAEFVS